MAFELIGKMKSLNATNDLSAHQFKFVKLNNRGEIDLCGAGQNAVGVLQNKPVAGQPGDVCEPGDITKIVCGGTFTAGADLTSDANGAAVAAATGNFILGQALAAGASGNVVTFVFQPKGSVA